jgi:hypothetical protein
MTFGISNLLRWIFGGRIADAHSKTEFKTIRYGIQQARRTGIEKTSVLNWKPLQELLALSTVGSYFLEFVGASCSLRYRMFFLIAEATEVNC